MKNTSIIKSLSLLGSGLLLAGTMAANAAPPKEAMCKACHGEGGAKPLTPVYPKLAGQNKEYLVASLKAYRAGQRQGGLASAMTAQAKNLTDAEIEGLAAFYAAQK